MCWFTSLTLCAYTGSIFSCSRVVSFSDISDISVSKVSGSIFSNISVIPFSDISVFLFII